MTFTDEIDLIGGGNGSWSNDPRFLRSALRDRHWFSAVVRGDTRGFRVARTLHS
jgi:formylglycine-generating enzyme required for sulfatase activity